MHDFVFDAVIKFKKKIFSSKNAEQIGRNPVDKLFLSTVMHGMCQNSVSIKPQKCETLHFLYKLIWNLYKFFLEIF